MSEQTTNEGLGMVDTWARFAQHDLPSEIERMRKGKMTLEQLQAELHSTVMHSVGQLAHMVVSMRDDAYERIADLESQVEELTEQVQDIETPPAETQLLPEDAESIGKLAAAAKMFAQEALKATGDLAAIAKLNEVIGIADYCEQLSKDKAIVDAEFADDPTDEMDGEDEIAVEPHASPEAVPQ